MANIKLIAQALVILSFKDMTDVAKILKEEYDIEPKEGDGRKFVLKTDDFEIIRREATIVEAQIKEEQKRKQKPYAPRKIGKPRGFPDNMRRK